MQASKIFFLKVKTKIFVFTTLNWIALITWASLEVDESL